MYVCVCSCRGWGPPREEGTCLLPHKQAFRGLPGLQSKWIDSLTPSFYRTPNPCTHMHSGCSKPPCRQMPATKSAGTAQETTRTETFLVSVETGQEVGPPISTGAGPRHHPALSQPSPGPCPFDASAPCLVNLACRTCLVTLTAGDTCEVSWSPGF